MSLTDPAVAGSESPIQAYLKRLHDRYADVLEGQVANYIPELAKANNRWFGICIATIDGHVYSLVRREPTYPEPATCRWSEGVGLRLLPA